MSMKVLSIPLDQIEIGERLRRIDEDKAAMMAESFRAGGQRQPVEVRPKRPDGKYPLIAGGHRMRAAQLAGFKTIFAVEKAVSEDEARLLEIDENLFRADLTALDRAIFLTERKALYLKMFPETAAGGDRRSNQIRKFADLKAPRFTEDTARRLGVSDDTIERAIRRASRLSAEVKAMLSGTALADKGFELDALAKIANPDVQRLAAEMVLQGKAPTVAAAWRIITNTEAPPTDKVHADFEAFERRWEKYAPETKRQIVALIMKEFRLDYLPAEAP